MAFVVPRFSRLFRSAPSVFHSTCDNKGPTITVVKSGANIFGGFTENAWKSKIN